MLNEGPLIDQPRRNTAEVQVLYMSSWMRVTYTVSVSVSVCVCATRPLTFPCPDSVSGERGMEREAEAVGEWRGEAFFFYCSPECHHRQSLDRANKLKYDSVCYGPEEIQTVS